MGIITTFIISFLLGFGYMYYAAKDDIKNAKNLKELKIRYCVEETEDANKQ